jgi:hypothetical protein
MPPRSYIRHLKQEFRAIPSALHVVDTTGHDGDLGAQRFDRRLGVTKLLVNSKKMGGVERALRALVVTLSLEIRVKGA